MSQQPTNSLPKPFLPILAFASFTSIAIIWFNLHILILAFFIFTPLIVYFSYVKKSAKDLNYNTIDSVYYFGFSLTIVTLATSAIIHFGLSSEIEDLQNLNLVCSQVGIGLLVTCLGLILRLFLLASMSKETEDEEQNARQSLIQDISELREEITGFASELKDINVSLKEQQNILNQGIIQGLKEATSELQNQCKQVQDSLIENQKQKNLELADYQSELQKSLFERMQDMNQEVYNNMQKANESHMDYVKKSQEQLINLAKDVGKSINDLEFHKVAQSAKKSVQLVSSAYEDMQQNITNFNDEMQKISKQYTDIHKQHQQQLHSTMQTTKASVESVNDALIEVANKASDHMKKQKSAVTSQSEQRVG